jgi:putative addiction module component (TIGR02574 family)
MDTTAILTQIDKLPVEERVVLVQRVWDSIADSDTPLELTDAQKAEIDRRSAELDANPDIAIPWEEVKRSLEDRRRG